MAQGLRLSLSAVYHGVQLTINPAEMLRFPEDDVMRAKNSGPTSGGSASRRETLRMPLKEISEES